MTALADLVETPQPPTGVRVLGGIDNILASEYGGKAASLHLLRHSKVPVPPGVAVPHDWRDRRAEVYYDVESRMRRIAERLGIPIGAFPMMVRSSAVAEDSDKSSFAGRYESLTDVYLDDFMGLLSSMDQVSKSAHSGRAKEYAKRRGVEDKERTKVGIVVQQMIIPEYAAIFFTRHPMGDEGAYVEVVEGHGEALVSGRATPIYSGRPEAASNNFHMAALQPQAELCAEIIGYPADVEAAFDGYTWWIVQARPITTLEE